MDASINGIHARIVVSWVLGHFPYPVCIRSEIHKGPVSHPSRFGPTTKDVGDPLPMIVTDSGAILKNKTAMGLSMIDRDYVRSHPGSALTVEQILNVPKVARLGCLTAMILGVAGLLLLSRALQPILPYDSER